MNADRLQDLIDWYASLRPETLPRLTDFYAPHCHFRDPIHDFQGAERLRRLYQQMFDRLGAPRFIICDHAAREDTAFIAWRFEARWRRHRVSFEGVSRLRFDGDGRVSTHVDQWDAASALYERVPLLGALLRGMRRRLSRSA